MKKLHPSSHRIDAIFVIALFTVFAATAFLAVLIGARQYKETANHMNNNYEVRTATSYLQEKVRQNDSNSGIHVVDFYDTKALSFSDFDGAELYTTYIYYYDGYLRELFVSEDAIYSPDSGQEIIAINNFSPELIKSNLLKITITNTRDESVPIYLTLHSDDRKELP